MSQNKEVANLKPHFDYTKFPHLSREGIVAETNKKFQTVSLFLETCPKGSEHSVMWCLSETEQWCDVTLRWVPSAWMCYIYAENEYDAMRKIVGNIRQWETLKSLKWFKDKYSMWESEQEMMVKALVKTSLARTVADGGAGATGAAKLLLEQLNTTVKRKPGRPVANKKGDNPAPEVIDPDVQDDINRIFPLTKQQ